MSLTLSSSVPLGLCSDSSPVSPSSAAADINVTNSKPVRRKHCMLSSTKRTQVVSYAGYVERRACLAAVSDDSGCISNSETLHHPLADVRTVQSELDSDAEHVHDTVCCRGVTPPVSRHVMRLPRSGSNITRKQAFYNIERPQSIVRRDSSSSCSISDECLDVTS